MKEGRVADDESKLGAQGGGKRGLLLTSTLLRGLSNFAPTVFPQCYLVGRRRQFRKCILRGEAGMRDMPLYMRHLLLEEGPEGLIAFNDDFSRGSLDMQHLGSFGNSESLLQDQPYQLGPLLNEEGVTSTEILEYLFFCLLFYIKLVFHYSTHALPLPPWFYATSRSQVGHEGRSPRHPRFWTPGPVACTIGGFSESYGRCGFFNLFFVLQPGSSINIVDAQPKAQMGVSSCLGSL